MKIVEIYTMMRIVIGEGEGEGEETQGIDCLSMVVCLSVAAVRCRVNKKEPAKPTDKQTDRPTDKQGRTLKLESKCKMDVPLETRGEEEVG